VEGISGRVITGFLIGFAFFIAGLIEGPFFCFENIWVFYYVFGECDRMNSDILNNIYIYADMDIYNLLIKELLYCFVSYKNSIE
jgi:hypothetical protein